MDSDVYRKGEPLAFIENAVNTLEVSDFYSQKIILQ